MNVVSAWATGKAALSAPAFGGPLTGDDVRCCARLWTVCSAPLRSRAASGTHSGPRPRLRGPRCAACVRVAARGQALKSAATQLATRCPAGPLLTARSRFADRGSQGLRCAQTARRRARTTSEGRLQSESPAQRHNPRCRSPTITPGAPTFFGSYAMTYVYPLWRAGRCGSRMDMRASPGVLPDDVF